jgi:hypothetical protein
MDFQEMWGAGMAAAVPVIPFGTWGAMVGVIMDATPDAKGDVIMDATPPAKGCLASRFRFCHQAMGQIWIRNQAAQKKFRLEIFQKTVGETVAERRCETVGEMWCERVVERPVLRLDRFARAVIPKGMKKTWVAQVPKEALCAIKRVRGNRMPVHLIKEAVCPVAPLAALPLAVAPPTVAFLTV